MSSHSPALTDAAAHAVITPWYSQFTIASRGDVRAIHDQVVAPEYRSHTGDGPGESWDRETSIKVIAGFAQSIPDMSFTVKEVFVVGDRAIVRGEVAGTPAGPLFGAPHTGKSFRIMAIDIQTIKDGKLVKTYHLENWLAALGQLRAA
jgi:ketosteroid isomerase-like protein